MYGSVAAISIAGLPGDAAGSTASLATLINRLPDTIKPDCSRSCVAVVPCCKLYEGYTNHCVGVLRDHQVVPRLRTTCFQNFAVRGA